MHTGQITTQVASTLARYDEELHAEVPRVPKDLALFIRMSQPPPKVDSAQQFPPPSSSRPTCSANEDRLPDGHVVLLPFLVIDMVVASILMSMGMMMLPPPIVSLPAQG